MNTLRQRLYCYLLECGFSPVHKGFKLLIDAVVLLRQSDFKIKTLSEDIYSVLSAQYGIKEDCIQKDIKNAIDYAVLKGDMDFFNAEFSSVMSPQGSVTAAAFIYFAAHKTSYMPAEPPYQLPLQY